MDDCVCLTGGYDGDANDFELTIVRRARREHQCSECREPIRPGTRYQVLSVKSEGEFSTTKTCRVCAEIRDTLYCGGGYYFGCLWEDITEQLFEPGGLNSACLAKLQTVEAKQQLARRWWAWVGEQGGSGNQEGHHDGTARVSDGTN